MFLIIVAALFFGIGIDALVGILGSRRNIGFGWAFIISLLFTPLVGLIAVLLSDPLAANTEPKYGCLGRTLGCAGVFVIGLIIATASIVTMILLMTLCAA